MDFFKNLVDKEYSLLGGSGMAASQRRLKKGNLFTRSWIRILGLLVGAIVSIFLISAYLSSGDSMINVNDIGINRLFQETDTKLFSKHCDNPSSGKPLVQYVLMIDAGSTGSRIHVYKFNHCKSWPELEDEVFEQTKPGLSSFENDADGAAKSLDSLMDIAMKSVPEKLRGCTPVSVKATAGLRLLGNEKSEKILNALRERLTTKYPFPLAKEENPISIIEGRDEGVYAWITVNYLLGILGNNGTKSAGTFDLGGGSAQIVFEPVNKSGKSAFTVDADTVKDVVPFDSTNSVNKYKYPFKYNRLDYQIYQHSYLGYGLNSARDKIFDEIIKTHSDPDATEIYHPCFPSDFEKKIENKKTKKLVTIKGKVAKAPANLDENKPKSNFESCIPIAMSIFEKNTCDVKPCTFSGVYQPRIEETFESNPFYIFSYFYDLTNPFGLGSEFKLRDIQNLAEKVCSHDHSLFPDPKHKKELQNDHKYCIDLTYIYTLLKHGIGISDNRSLKTTRKINEIETGWCLGAALAILDKNKYCTR
ncbi:hypothetical protein BB559_000624 [Furculomyces boomerangus]|uniref:guanosine-diphosphatase n=2 Tax=Harpellales TaxID=61421 RepID=A0A2T9Z4K1_9FUNG|nr:hypothetical protein BB559_000624 [Furculomyces boomerangus]PVZ97008.1 hypothetical protein BB558_007052 [Smittium angustum]